MSKAYNRLDIPGPESWKRVMMYHIDDTWAIYLHIRDETPRSPSTNLGAKEDPVKIGN